MITLYGIKNCDTIKKARRWLEAQGIDYRFHDYQSGSGLDRTLLQSFISELGWEALSSHVEPPGVNSMNPRAVKSPMRLPPPH